jgi:creatinine amidohydrolase
MPKLPYMYAHLAWPEIQQAVDDNRVILLPVGAIEQHGPHLPLETDVIGPREICEEVGRRSPEDVLVMPAVPYGYTHHVMDFPGTINVSWDHFIHYVLDITKSLAYHGFKRIAIVNGHGSNHHLLELVGRQTNLLTDATCATFTWNQLSNHVVEEVRTSPYPGGVGHACEMETSVLMHVTPDLVIGEAIKDELPPHDEFWWIDSSAGAGPVTINEWTTTYSQSGTVGSPEHATAEKGEKIFEETVVQLGKFVKHFRTRPDTVRTKMQRPEPEGALPFFS